MALSAGGRMLLESKPVNYKLVNDGLLFPRGISSCCKKHLLPSPLFYSSPKSRPDRRLSASPARASSKPYPSHPALEAQTRAEVASDELTEFSAEGAMIQEEEAPLSQKTLIWRALKLPIYSVALVPLCVGSAAAFYNTKVFYASRFALLLGSGVLVMAWLHLSNDVYDADTGVDKSKRESVVNMIGNRDAVLVLGYACLALGIGGIIWGSRLAQNVQVFALQAGAIACGYVYQCPPFRLSYKGLGEPLCFLAFGPLATIAFYLSQGNGSHTLPINGTIVGAAVLVGLTTTLMLFCSHFHQIEGDERVGKRSPLVKLGTVKGKEIVKSAVISLYSLVFVMAGMKWLPLPCAILILFTAPIGKLVVDFVLQNHDNKEIIFLAKYFCVRLHVAFGAALGLGFVVATKMGM